MKCSKCWNLVCLEAIWFASCLLIVTGFDIWVLKCPVPWQCWCVNIYLCTPEDYRKLRERNSWNQYLSITNPSQVFLGNEQYFQPSLTPGSHLPFFIVSHSTTMQVSPKFHLRSGGRTCAFHSFEGSGSSPALSGPLDHFVPVLCVKAGLQTTLPKGEQTIYCLCALCSSNAHWCLLYFVWCTLRQPRSRTHYLIFIWEKQYLGHECLWMVSCQSMAEWSCCWYLDFYLGVGADLSMLQCVSENSCCV